MHWARRSEVRGKHGMWFGLTKTFDWILERLDLDWVGERRLVQATSLKGWRDLSLELLGGDGLIMLELSMDGGRERWECELLSAAKVAGGAGWWEMEGTPRQTL